MSDKDLIYFGFRNEKELEFRVYERGFLFHASKKKSFDGKTKKAIKSTTSQLNHFLDYLRRTDEFKEDGADSDLWYVVVKIMTLDQKLDRNNMDDVAQRRVEENYTPFREEIVDYFKEVVRNQIVNDNYLIKLVSDYSYQSSKFNLQKSDIKEKLYYSDLHIYQCLSLFSKILYLLYFRISEMIGYTNLVKSMIIDLSVELNHHCLDLFPNEYNIVNSRSFMDRLFGYIEFQNTKNSRKHKRIIQKFSAVGYSHEYFNIEILESVLSSMKSFQPRPYDKKMKKYEYSVGEDNLDDWGYISRATVKWISSTTTNTIFHLTRKTTPYVINTVNPDADSEHDDAPESSKYEILLEKKDREHYEDMKRLKKYIVNDSKRNGRLSDQSRKDIERIIEEKINVRHLLNEFMMSLFLEQEYDVNVMDLLTYREYLIILFRIYERLEGYFDLTHALISKEANRQNGKRFSDHELENLDFYNAVNNDRTKKILNRIIARSYTYNNPKTGTISLLNIKDDLKEFIKKGMVI